MDSAFAKNPSDLLRSVDPVWDRIREAAHSAAAAEPVLAGTLHATILSSPASRVLSAITSRGSSAPPKCRPR